MIPTSNIFACLQRPLEALIKRRKIVPFGTATKGGDSCTDSIGVGGCYDKFVTAEGVKAD